MNKTANAKRLSFHKASRKSRSGRVCSMVNRWRRCFSLVVNRKTPAELRAYISDLKITCDGDMAALLDWCNRNGIVIERPGGKGTAWSAESLAASLAQG